MPVTREELHNKLERELKRPVYLTLTKNRVSMVRTQSTIRGLSIRLHSSFLDAPQQVFRALVRWLKNPKKPAGRELQTFINELMAKNATVKTPERVLRSKGKIYDLACIAARVNEEYFDSRLKYFITYGRDTSRKAVRSRRLGSYRHSEKLIVIHPILDAPNVPEYVVEFTIYHEMLHSLQPPTQRRVHDRVFHEAEKRHPHYEEVHEWQKTNMDYLLSGALANQLR